jgi:F0F1-type ATP synthase assembly protein I
LQRQKLGEWGHYAGFGVQYAVTIGVFALIGWKLDGWLGSEPWLLITLLFLGFLGATISLVKQLPTSPRSAPRGGPDR